MREGQRIKLIKAGIGKVEKAANRRKYECIFPGCNELAIKSHSQQKKHQLNSISENSHVFAMNKSMYNIFSGDFSELLRLTPIGSASRYNGYCNKHDTNIFSPIENGNINIGIPEHNYLLLLRSISHEYATKRDMYDRQEDVLSKIGDLFSYEGMENYKASHAGVKYYLNKDAPYYLSKLFEIYESKDWSQISYNSFEIDRNIGVSSTTSFSPFREEHLDWMHNNFEEVQPFISFSLVPEANKTSISFVWFSEYSQFCSEFERLEKDQKDIIQIINTYVLCESEDVCIKPSLWNKLSQQERYEIYSHMGNSESLRDANTIPMVLG